MNLYPHQIKAVEDLTKIVKQYNFAYLFGEPRIGKSLIALEVAKKFTNHNILVITKKAAIEGWTKYKDNYTFDVINYESLHKKKSKDYDVVVVDEAHNYGVVGKANARIKSGVTFCKNKVVIYLSGTPVIETPLRIYYQLKLSSYTPFKGTFYDFFRQWGIPKPMFLYGRAIETYSEAKPELLQEIDKWTIKVKHSVYNNEDEVIYIDKTKEYAQIEHQIARKGYLDINSPFETSSEQWQCAHQHEGGFYRGQEFKHTPKLDWLMNFVKDKQKVCIMAYFVNEQKELAKRFTHCTVLSSTKYCEGIDLSSYDYYILYSFGYSGAKFVQLRDRIVNIQNAHKKTKVILPLIKGGFCSKVYAKVSAKRNFNIRSFTNF